MALFARAEETWQIAHTSSTLLRSIRGWKFGREQKSGSGDMLRSLAKKGPFSALPGKLTQKTLARVYYQVFGKRCPGVGTLRFLLYPCWNFPTLERCSVGWKSMTDFRVSQVRVKYSTRLALKRLGNYNYYASPIINHTTVLVIGVLGNAGAYPMNSMIMAMGICYGGLV